MEAYIELGRYRNVVKTFRTLTTIENITEFSSDDFRRFGLDRFLRDPEHATGGFFAQLAKMNLIHETGRTRSEIPSNHYREIRLWTWNPKAVQQFLQEKEGVKS